LRFGGLDMSTQVDVYQNHISIAMGSHGELETELEIAFRHDLLDRAASARILETSDRVGAMLNRLHDSLD
jgi:four helix bundle protein